MGLPATDGVRVGDRDAEVGVSVVVPLRLSDKEHVWVRVDVGDSDGRRVAPGGLRVAVSVRVRDGVAEALPVTQPVALGVTVRVAVPLPGLCDAEAVALHVRDADPDPGSVAEPVAVATPERVSVPVEALTDHVAVDVVVALRLRVRENVPVTVAPPVRVLAEGLGLCDREAGDGVELSAGVRLRLRVRLEAVAVAECDGVPVGTADADLVRVPEPGLRVPESVQVPDVAVGLRSGVPVLLRVALPDGVAEGLRRALGDRDSEAMLLRVPVAVLPVGVGEADRVGDRDRDALRVGGLAEQLAVGLRVGDRLREGLGVAEAVPVGDPATTAVAVHVAV